MTCQCCANRRNHVYMDGCDQCKARWIARLPGVLRERELQRLPELRDAARAEYGADLRELRGGDAVEPYLDQVRGSER